MTADTAIEFRALLDDQVEMVSLARPDGTLVYLNTAYARHYGQRVDAMTGRSLYDFVSPRDRELVRSKFANVCRTGIAKTNDNRTLHSDGQVRWVSWTNALHLDGSGAVFIHSVGRDVTERHLAESALKGQSAIVDTVLESIPALIAVVGSDLRYRLTNHALERWLQAEPGELIGRSIRDVFGENEFERHEPWIRRVLAGETVGFEHHYPERAQICDLAVNLVPLRLPDGSTDGFVTVAQDITRHRQEAIRLQQLASRDPLTGLLNRSGIQAFADRLFDPAASAGRIACLCIDLDRFKLVNDAHGHLVGDHVLRTFADRLNALVRPVDGVARLGGDEFAIVLCGVRNEQDTQTLATRIADAASMAIEIDGLSLQTGASVGVAIAEPVDTWPTLYARADAMMYIAKRAGRERQAGTANPSAVTPGGATVPVASTAQSSKPDSTARSRARLHPQA